MNGVIKKIRTAYVAGKRHGVYVEVFFPDQQLKWGDKIELGSTMYWSHSNPHDKPYWDALAELRAAEDVQQVTEIEGKADEKVISRFAAIEVD